MADEWSGGKYRVDEDGLEWALDENGRDLRVNGERVPGRPRKTSKPGEFTTYDTSQGHCALCGSLKCRGGCFK